MMNGITAPKKTEGAPKGADSKAKQAEAPKVEQETVKAEAPKPAAPVQDAPKFAHTVAKGRSVTSKKGILKEGCEIKAEWLGGGEQSLKQLIDKKIVIKA